jgi:uncharacterized membrane protein
MRGRWLVIGLVASIALNLFLIGAGAGVIALGLRMAREAASGPSRPIGLVLASEGLPQPDRRDFRLLLRDVRDEVKADSDRSLAIRRDAWGALADPKPDAAAIAQKLEQTRQIDIGVRARIERRIVDYAIKMPAADRAIFAAGMRRVLTPRVSAAAPGAAAPGNAAPGNAAPAKG